ncbi:rCG45882 [Rattus norvegicus]|uniref:RCG45882 n=1 Tax=Rattus norvegicus TaxID=10116 RepID=A6JTI2_RAT|nr:rCG45882 [Rattus norvegicus]
MPSTPQPVPPHRAKIGIKRQLEA